METLKKTFNFSNETNELAFMHIVVDHSEHRPELLERLINTCWDALKNQYTPFYEANWNEVRENLNIMVIERKAVFEAEARRQGHYNFMGVY